MKKMKEAKSKASENPFSLLEAVLFACGEPIEITRLAAGLNVDTAAIREQLLAYSQRLKAEDRGIELLFLGETVQPVQQTLL